MPDSSELQAQHDELRHLIVGLSKHSVSKSCYPELQQLILDLERSRLLLDQSSDAVMLFAVPSGQILDCNETACRFLGRSLDILRSRTLFSLIDPATEEQAARLFSDARIGILRKETFTSTFATAAGTVFPVEISLKTVKIDRSIFAVADVRNISERLHAENVLKESEARYRALFEDSRDAIYMALPNGDFTDINMAGVEMLGYSTKEEVFQLNVEQDLYADPLVRRQSLQRLSDDGCLKDYEVLLRKRDGEYINVLLTSSAMIGDHGSIIGYRGIMRDITGHKKLEQQLLQSQKMEAIGRLTAGIAHDFNNILTSILGYATMVDLKLAEQSPMKKHIGNIILSAERAAVLIKRLLSFSRQQKISMLPVDASSIVISTGNLIAEVIGQDVTLDIMPSNRELLVNADRGQIEQALINLITNARDAMPHGGTLRIQCEPYLLGDDFIRQYCYGEPGTYALISVADTGTGMDSTILQKLFEPFFTTKEVGKGTGLGLSIVYGIMKQHGGFINVESALGSGSTFRLYLPLIRQEKDSARTRASSE